MKLQTIFNKVRKHLLKQNNISGCTGHGCAYRGIEGRKCAIGFLIKDEHYKTSLEGSTVNNGNVRTAISKSLKIKSFNRLEPLGELLEVLQNVHDDYFPNNWEDRLNKIMVDYSHLLKLDVK